jgi:hypothetical protein
MEREPATSPSHIFPCDSCHCVVMDIETENTGFDIMNDNKRIISIQLGNVEGQELYYADAPRFETSLDQAVIRLNQLIDEGKVLAGYNIEGFDIPLLQRFLDVNIPRANRLDIGTIGGLYTKRRAAGKSTSLEAICIDLGIDVGHKQLMNSRAEQLKMRPEIRAKAEAGALYFSSSKFWSLDFSRRCALDKVAGGYAILEAYLEFVRSSGSKDTLFYRYAVGDVISESQLLRHLLESGSC